MTMAWRHVTDRFQGFLARIEPAAAERGQALAAAHEVERLLRRRFPIAREAGGPGAGGEPLVIGGYGKDTAIGGGNDVDLLFVLPERSRITTAGDFVLVSPSCRRAIVEMATVLAARYGAVDWSSDGWLGVVVRGEAQARTHVRVLAAFACDRQGFLVPAAGTRNGGAPAEAWRQMNPLAELAYLNRVDGATGGKARDLIRMAKAWRRTARVPMLPLALELLVCEFLSVWLYHRRSTFFYDWMIRDFFFWLSAQEGRPLAIPGSGHRLASGDGWRSDAERAYTLAGCAADLERDNRGRHAAACWRLVFGDDFPLAADDAKRGRMLPPPLATGALSVSP